MSAARDRHAKDGELASVRIFLEETEERLDAITDTLTLLESSVSESGSDETEPIEPGLTSDAVHQLFREFHAIKGAGSFLGFAKIVQITHESEDLLQEIRDEDRPFDRTARVALAQSARSLYQLLRKPLVDEASEDPSVGAYPGRAIGSGGDVSNSDGPDEGLIGLGEVTIEDVRRRSETLSSLIAQTVPLSLTESRRELLPYVVLDLEQTVQDALLFLQDAHAENRGAVRQQLLEACKDLRSVLAYFGSATLECDLDAIQTAVQNMSNVGDASLPQLLPRMNAIFEVMLLRLSRLSEERDLLLHVDPLRHRLRTVAEGRSLPREAELPGEATLEDVYQIDGVYVRAEETESQSTETTTVSATQRLVRHLELLTENLSQLTQRPVRFESQFEESDLPDSLLDALSGPLAQILRNCMDHGIEDIAERKAAGKEEVGTIRFAIDERDGQVEVTVTDNGRGIDAEVVARRAVERGLLSAENASRLSTSDKLRLILMPGLSTRETVSTLSGRGVGMDLVASDLRQLGGSITIESTPRVGSYFALRVPSPGARLWTFEIDGVLYGLPVDHVLAVCEIDSESSPSCWQTEDGPIPRVSLCDILTHVAGNATFAVILTADGEETAFTVPLKPRRERFPTQMLPSAVLHATDALIRSIGAGVDGSACLVLDPVRLTKLASERRERAFHISNPSPRTSQDAA